MSCFPSATAVPLCNPIQTGRRHRLIRISLVTTTALVAAGTSALADSGTPCTMFGGACVITGTGTTSSNHPPGGSGSSGDPGGAGPGFTTVLTNPQSFTDNLSNKVFFSPITMTSYGGSGIGGASSNANVGGTGGQGGAGGLLNLTVSAPTFTGTSASIASGVAIVSNGGTAGGGAPGPGGGGTSGTGGAGGQIIVNLSGAWTSILGGGLTVQSNGGTGGQGQEYGSYYKFGVDGGTGGNGGDVNVTINGQIQGQTNGARIYSAGGTGGAGGKGDSAWSGQGGNGGNGGNGGTVTVTLSSGAQVLGDSASQAGLWAQSLGGQGGQGGGGEIGGNGGQGGNAGNVTVTVNGTVKTAAGSASPGVLAQSLGSVGGGGGHATDWSFNPTSGDGNNGGTTGTVTVTGTGAAITTGVSVGDSETAPGVLAQSIGGFGGVGSNAKGWFAVGGSGGNGASGNAASASLTSSTVETFGFNSPGLQAQSIGGGGGKGGDAQGSGVVVNMVIGGTGGGGGGAADAYAANLGAGSITTHDDHAAGVIMQSIGGGGGSGGSAYGRSFSAFYGAALAVGGSGGSGGSGGTVNNAQAENNAGRILTSGAESFGILGQSIGGGGGQGGASTAKSVVQSGGDFPGLSLSMSTGGSGGLGGTASGVYLQSSGLIATSGLGAIGMLGQAVGGGGGTGGDATGASKASGGELNFSATVSHGGSGGSGGHGGNVTGANNGLILTRGESADGMLVQSIGGGGGNGGAGDAKSSTGADKSLSMTLTMGGSSGGGGQGYNVSATNTGAIVTLGDGALGIGAQTIGGGGGRAGGAAASNSGTITTNVALGGRGGNGGDTYYQGSNSQVTNSGTVLTFGADATGILAQSIGGGGGVGGKAGTSLGDKKSNNDGSNGSDTSVNSTVSRVAQNFANKGSSAMGDYNSITALLATANQLLGNSASVAATNDDPGDGLDEAAGSGGETDDGNETKSTSLTVAIGGKGGNGGAAGYITVTNSGTVATMGKHADAIVVQAIGGGGGKGGAASTATSADLSGSVAIGGTGGGTSNVNSNNGGRPTVHNSGSIYTMGALSGGIVAQSIGNGGGIGGSSSATTTDDSGALGAESGKSVSLNISLGGTAGANGAGEAAWVDSSGAIQTRGHDSYGIIAQSISGGGGIVKTLATDLDNAGGSATASSSKDFSANIKLGGNGNNTSRFSGAAFVTTTKGGTITTRGDNGIGILAQSVAGGGGIALGGKPNGTTAADFLGSGNKSGAVNLGLSTNPDDNQGVHVEVGDRIDTYGQGGVGVFAQSVGGGGGIAGDIGWTMQVMKMGRGSNHTGNGGDIQVSVDQGATITTRAANSAGIIAQSVGGGGGWIANQNGAFVGSAGGTGLGGLVNVSVQGSVDAQGAASPGIFAQSTGGADNGGVGVGMGVAITVGSTTNTEASVTGGNGFGDAAAAIYIANGSMNPIAPNTLTNYGTIATHDTTNGTAVYSGAANLAGTNYGTITGNIHLASGAISNQGSGTINPYSAIDLGGGLLTNRGTLDLTGEGRVTRLTGDYLGRRGSRVVVGVDFGAGAGDRLDVSGDATFAGTIEIRPETLRKQAVEIARVRGALTLDDELAAADTSTLFDYAFATSGSSLTVTPDASFARSASGFGQNRQALGNHLQRLWDGGAIFEGYTALASIADNGSYRQALETANGETLGAIAALRFAASRNFAADVYGCPKDGAASVVAAEGSCVWMRAFGSKTRQGATSNALGYDMTSTMLQVGGQWQFAPNWFAGASLAYETSRLEGDHDVATIDGDNVLAAAALTYRSGGWLLSGAVDGGYGWYDSRRSIVVGSFSDVAEASPTAWHVGLHGRAAYEMAIGNWYMTPSASVHAIYARGNGFTEMGAGPFNLAVEDQDGFAFTTTAAVEVGTRIDLGGYGVLRPFLGAGVSFTAADDWTTKARFASLPGVTDSFSTASPVPDVLGKLTAGVELAGSSRWDVRVQYDAEMGQDYLSHTGVARLSVHF